MRPYLVYTPPSCNDTTATPQRYPVLYLLDGDAHFHSVTGLIQILGTGVNGTYVVPEMIVVAIPNTDRMRDMTPTNTEVGFDGKPQSGFRTSGGMPASRTSCGPVRALWPGRWHGAVRMLSTAVRRSRFKLNLRKATR